jgi:ubiquinone/menaquinone biosynthesis C-methylase UbiE
VVQSVVEAADVQPGQSIVEVARCSGAVARCWLASPAGTNPIVALDVNEYLLREALSLTLTRAAGLAERITYGTGDAESLPLPSDSADLALSRTVMEKVNADRKPVRRRQRRALRAVPRGG